MSKNFVTGFLITLLCLVCLSGAFVGLVLLAKAIFWVILGHGVLMGIAFLCISVAVFGGLFYMIEEG